VSVTEKYTPVKRIAYGGGIQLAGLALAMLTAACVLESSTPGLAKLHADDASVDLELRVRDADTVFDWEKDIGRIRIEAHAVPLAVPHFPDAVVVEPCETVGPRPVVVVLHGLNDRPEPHCEAWRTITGAEDFVLCLRGSEGARSDTGRRRYTLAGGTALVAHVHAALAALVAQYGDRVDPARPLLVGFSLGATEAALLAQRYPERFPRVAVLEGGLDVWGDSTIGPFVTGGARRVLFGCGSAWCPALARAAAERIGAFALQSHVAFADVGHHDAPALQQALKRELAWFVDGDPRWESAIAPTP
jgi:pimeloyl-ACP methyl ester carboxylesterase